MLRKIFLSLVLTSAFTCLCGCQALRNLSVQDLANGNWAKTEQNSSTNDFAADQINKVASIVVCRSHQCAPAKIAMSKEYIFNSLLQLFDNNNYQKMLVCQADPQSHTCIENYITLPVYVGVVPTKAYIDNVKITDVVVGKQGSFINLVLNYNITYGGQVAECTPAKSLLFARSVNHVIMEDSGYNCKMTTIGMTNIKSVFTIDYIDLDYGYIGGFYSIGFSGPAYGGNTDYMILRLPRNAYPLSPALQAPKTKNANKFNTATTSSQSNNTDGNYSANVQIFPLAKKGVASSNETNNDSDSNNNSDTETKQ